MRRSSVRARSSVAPTAATLLLALAMACEEPTLALPTSPGVFPPLEPAATGYVYLADSSGAVLRRLARGGWPSWSPDGRRIVFHQDGHLRVIDADGTNEIGLADGQWPTWSPDGSRIVFVSKEGLSVVNADGLAVRRLMSQTLAGAHDWGVGKPSWSPDGALIVFDEPGAYEFGATARIFAMRADGSSQYVVAGDSDFESDPSWSPDGSRVVYWSNRYGLGIVARSGGATLQLNKNDVEPFSARPAWSPDGRTILFNGKQPASGILSTSPEGGRARVLIERGADAAWSPDGTRIAFVRSDPK